MNVSARRVAARLVCVVASAWIAGAAAAAPAPREIARGPSVRRVPARPDSIEGLPIVRVEIVPRNVYDADEHGRLAPLHRLANRLHIRTRRATVRQQLLFEPGDPWSERLAQETGRNLRALNFLEPSSISARREDDSVSVVVETRDFWTTRPEINVESSGGTQYGSVGFTERNLLGLGKSLSVQFRSQPTGNSRLFAWEDPAVLSSRHQLQLRATRGEETASDRYTFQLPYYSQEAPRAYVADWQRSRSVPRLYHAGVEAARLDRHAEYARVSYGWKLAGADLVRRLELSYESFDRTLGPTQLAPGAPATFLAPAEDLRIRRVDLGWSVWRPRYVELVDIDRMDRVEDFDLGTRGALTVGLSPRVLGSGQDEGYFEASLMAGVEALNGFGWVRASGSSRMVPAAQELIGSIDARWYVLPYPGHTVVLAAHGVAGDKVPNDFQVVVGGLDGLRAYPVQAVAGQRLWRLNAEERWIFSPPSWELAKLGAVAFVDAAKAWGLGAEGTDWHHDAGVGLRVGLPVLGVAEVLRVDVAWPLVPTRDGRREPVLSIGSSQGF